MKPEDQKDPVPHLDINSRLVSQLPLVKKLAMETRALITNDFTHGSGRNVGQRAFVSRPHTGQRGSVTAMVRRIGSSSAHS